MASPKNYINCSYGNVKDFEIREECVKQDKGTRVSLGIILKHMLNNTK